MSENPTTTESSGEIQEGLAAAGGETVTPGPTKRFARRFRRQGIGMFGLGLFIFLVLVAIFAPMLATHDPASQDIVNRFTGPGAEHWLGNDDLGRDAYSRLLHGARISILAPFIALAIAIGVGVPLGLLAGYIGGWFDWAFSRLADGVMSLPPLILALALVAVLGPSTTNAMIAIGIVYIPRLFRVVRGSTLAVREETFIEASYAIGVRRPSVLFTHVLPNVAPPVLVQVSLMLGFAVLAEASLSFLGIGVQPPDASWGVLLRRGFVNLQRGPWLAIPPGLAIMALVLSFQFIGDGLRDSLGREIRRG